jgi:hypothetical protein
LTPTEVTYERLALACDMVALVLGESQLLPAMQESLRGIDEALRDVLHMTRTLP